ncbi:MAG: TonB-dependent receptor plug domain-containing protein [bacterium]
MKKRMIDSVPCHVWWAVFAAMCRKQEYVSRIVILFLLCIFLTPSLNLCASINPDTDLTDLSLEELMDLKVTSVAKKPQKYSDTAAALFVITDEDIRRSGVTSIAEALRLVPGLHVGRIDANKWAIASRGFNDRYTNKLLVLMDGRSLYLPMYSGVLWELQDTILEDIARIEVIRGPGATMWGANAVNGVINIITKKAEDTLGSLIIAGSGTEEKDFESLRHGVQPGDNTYMRAYAKHFNRDKGVDASGNDMNDDWDMLRGGFRCDWLPSPQVRVTGQGDIYNSRLNNLLAVSSLLSPPTYMNIIEDRTESSGRNFLFRWEYFLSDSSDMSLQLYYDWAENIIILGGFYQETYDSEFQHRFTLGDRHEIIWGCGYRIYRDYFSNTEYIRLTPRQKEILLFSTFIQDEIMILKDKLRLIVGSKYEHHGYTGAEIQPNIRLSWKPKEHHSVWVSVARAMRTPCRAERDAHIDMFTYPPNSGVNFSSLPLLVSFEPNQDFDSEELLAYELGYRLIPRPQISLDISLFYNIYDNLRSFGYGLPYLGPSDGPQHLVMPVYFSNEIEGETYGVELVTNWMSFDWWAVQATYSYLKISLREMDQASALQESTSPQNQASCRFSLDFSNTTDCDVWVRYVDNLSSIHVDRYVTMDIRLGWHPYKDLEINLVGQNLLDDHHPEFTYDYLQYFPSEVERGAYVKMSYRF